MGHRQIWRFGPGALLAVLALLAAVAWPRVALAGGVSVTLDRQPADVEAGKPFTVGFMVRSAHDGREPITGLAPAVIATNPATDERVAETAKADGDPGHYAATLTLPSAGEWRWQIQPFGLNQQDMTTTQPSIQVRAAGASAAPPVNAPAAAGTTTEVPALDNFFKPPELTVTAGTTVKWTNAGKLPHTVTAADGRFASGNLEPGAAFSYTFAEPGTYKYYCEYHASRPEAAAGGIVPISSRSGGGGHMVGTITVTAAAKQEAVQAQPQNAAAAPAKPDSQLANVVPGQPAAPANAASGGEAAQAANTPAGQATMPATGMPAVPVAVAVVLALILVTLGLALGRRRAGSVS